MQVLGIIPKKFKKKTDSGDKSQTCQDINIKNMKNSPQKHHIDGKSCNSAKIHNHSKNHTHATNCKSSLKGEILSNRTSRNPGKKAMPPLRWATPSHIWKKLIKKQKAGKTDDESGTLGGPDVRKLSHLCKRKEVEMGDLFRIYSMYQLFIANGFAMWWCQYLALFLRGITCVTTSLWDEVFSYLSK